MRNGTVGLILLFILSLYSAASVSWYFPSAHIPAVVFGVFPVMGTLGILVFAVKKKAI